MPRTPVIAANWKMYKTRPQARSMVEELVGRVADVEDVEVVICPPATAIETVAAGVTGSRIRYGAQNAHWEDEGAFTSQLSVPMLEEMGCRYVILGHSECRQYLGETDAVINRKLTRVLVGSMTPILCCGESLEQRESGRVSQVVLGQLEQDCDGLTPEIATRLILAYEPIWAIGTGRTATPEIAQEVHYMIRNWLSRRFSGDVASRVRILYGGSVKPSNVGDLMAQDDIDGALVGGASLEASSFAALVRFRS